MFSSISARFRDMGTIRRLSEMAEAHALQDRQQRPGAEHFLLAALDLDDGTARRAFKQSGVDPDGFRLAIERQYAAALDSVGIAVAPAAIAAGRTPRRAEPGVYRAAPSGQEVMQALAASRRGHAPLLGAHIVAIVASMPHGVAARALRTMGADAATLRAAADEIAGNRAVA